MKSMSVSDSITLQETTPRKAVYKKIMRHWQFYLLILLPLSLLITFKYVPMYGATLAFKDFNVVKGINGSPWAGLKHFQYFFEGPYFWLILKNTLGISIYGLLVGFPLPILFALALNEVGSAFFKRFVQLVTYAPHFISTVIVVSMMSLLLSPQVGVINNIFESLVLKRLTSWGIPLI